METLKQFLVVPKGAEGSPRGSCEGCGKQIWSDGGYSIPKLAGLHCSVACIEAHLFGTERCRWCGTKMEKQYTTVDSRLCNETCSENYYKQVMGDRTAALGTGVRFIGWLQRTSPDTYRRLTGEIVASAKLVTKPTKNGHVMTDAERSREYRNRKPRFVTKAPPSLLLSEPVPVTL
jgi:hypothetical protein